MKALPLIAAAVLAVLAIPGTASANHSWGNYHWARSQNPFTVSLGDNVSSAWDSYLSVASGDWTRSTVLDTRVVSGGSNSSCRPTSGRVEVCNRTYGSTGWLGVAQIWANGSHITQGTVRLNDTYFNTATYNTPAWRQLVTCQEVGHTFGLAHQDENFNNPNLGTCMDYTNSPGTNQHPNAHDYAQLETIYSHLDAGATSTTRPGNGRQSLDRPADWGRAVSRASDGTSSSYVRDLGNDHKVFTFVLWVR
ncbi:zinc metalloprotease [Flindersiella endophytica]